MRAPPRWPPLEELVASFGTRSPLLKACQLAGKFIACPQHGEQWSEALPCCSFYPWGFP